MSIKEWVFGFENGVGVFQECIYDLDSYEVNFNFVVIYLEYFFEIVIIQKIINDEMIVQFILEVSIVVKMFDRIVIDWCRNCKFNINKYMFEELFS